MKKGLTELVFLLDCSGSMEGLEEDTVGSFRAMLEKQKKQPGECLVSTILFNHEIRRIHNRVRLQDLCPMTEEEYRVRGCTALIDALGSTIDHIASIHKCIQEEAVPERTVFVITTDGMENASRRYQAGKVRSMVRRSQRERGWEFLFLGANIDAVSTAKSYGLRPDRAVTFTNDARGVATNYEAISAAITRFRENTPLRADWKSKIEKDHAGR